MLSTAALSTHLVKFGASFAPFGPKEVKAGKAQMMPGFGISNETFGRASMLFIHCPDHATRLRLERFLTSKGAKVHTDYSPLGDTLEVQVTYFKGGHLDE